MADTNSGGGSASVGGDGSVSITQPGYTSTLPTPSATITTAAEGGSYGDAAAVYVPGLQQAPVTSAGEVVGTIQAKLENLERRLRRLEGKQ